MSNPYVTEGIPWAARIVHKMYEENRILDEQIKAALDTMAGLNPEEKRVYLKHLIRHTREQYFRYGHARGRADALEDEQDDDD